MTDKETEEMIDLTKEDMDAVERAFAKEEAEERFERWLDRIWNAVLALGALAFLALVWWLVREKELADMEERRRDPQGAAARAGAGGGGRGGLPRLPRRRAGRLPAAGRGGRAVSTAEAASALEAAVGGMRLCETDYLAAIGARFPESSASDLSAFNELTLPRGGLDIYAEERAERRRYRAVALFFSYDQTCADPFSEYLKRELASARRGRAFA